MEQYQSQAKNPSKREWAAILRGRIEKAIAEGMTPEEAIGTLTLRQYDFLVDCGEITDDDTLNTEQQKIVTDLMRKGTGRPTFPAGYNKKYPLEKREFFEKLTDFILAEGGDIRPRPKCNYRNIEFDLGGKYYEIVFSCPPKKQGQ